MKVSALLWLLAIFALVGLGWYMTRRTTVAPTTNVASDAKNATYIIDGQSVKLNNGQAESPAAPGSATLVETNYFGNEVTGDFDGDGRADIGFLLTQSTGGSGTFYYVVVARNTAAGYVGSNAVLLGDRIAPQTTSASGTVITVNYAERKVGEPMTTQPSEGASVRVALTPTTQQLVKVSP